MRARSEWEQPGIRSSLYLFNAAADRIYELMGGRTIRLITTVNGFITPEGPTSRGLFLKWDQEEQEWVEDDLVFLQPPPPPYW